MSHNPVENAFLAAAIKSLGKQYADMGGANGFGLGKTPLMLVDGPKGWEYLTVIGRTEHSGGREIHHPDPKYTPVTCYPPEPPLPGESICEHFLRRENEVGLPVDL